MENRDDIEAIYVIHNYTCTNCKRKKREEHVLINQEGIIGKGDLEERGG